MAGKPSKTKPSSPAKAAPALGRGVWSHVLPLGLGSIVLTGALTAALALVVLQPAEQRARHTQAEATATAGIDSLVQLSRTYQRLLADAGRSQEMRLNLNDDSARALLTERLAGFLPHASLVRIYPTGAAAKDNSTNPPISYAQLDMISRSRTADKPIHPEIHGVDGQRFLTLVAPIPGTSTAAGAILVSFNLRDLQALYHLPETGKFELIQTFANNSQTVLSGGQSALPASASVTVDSDYSHWQARFTPAQPGLMQQLLLPGTIATAATIGLLMLLTVISIVRLRNALRANSQELADFFQSMLQGSPGERAFSLGAFDALSHTLRHVFSTHPNTAHILAGGSPRKRTSASSEAGGDSQIPDLQVTGADDDYFNGNQSEAEVSAEVASTAPTEPAPEPTPLEFAVGTTDKAEASFFDDLDDQPLSADLGVNEIAPVPADLFHGDRIRSSRDIEFTPEHALAIGRGLGSWLLDADEQQILIVADGLASSDHLAQLQAGLSETGIQILTTESQPLALVSFAVHAELVSNAVWLGHVDDEPSQPELVLFARGKAATSETLDALEQVLNSGPLRSGRSEVTATDLVKAYIERIGHDVVLARPMHIAVSAASTATARCAAAMLEHLGCRVKILDATAFPPSAGTLAAFSTALLQEGADMGLSFDARGERIAAITPGGRAPGNDRLLMLFARDLLARNPGADVLYDVACSRDVSEHVSALGGRALLCPSHPHQLRAQMLDSGAVVGATYAGHFSLNDRWSGDIDALYAAARLLEILSMEPLSTEEIFEEFPDKPATPYLTIPLPVSEQVAGSDLVARLANEATFADGNLVNVDGVRVDFPDSWGLIRAVATAPVLLARFEADNDDALMTIQTRFREQLTAIDPSLELPF